MRHALYVVGEPGAGKSTVVGLLTSGSVHERRAHPFHHCVHENGVVELGDPARAFPGTDALSLSVQPTAVAWAADTDATLLLGEGDRLATAGFFDALLKAGWDLRIAALRVSPETAAGRRAGRGSDQDEQWIKGRRSKVATIAGLYPERVTYIRNEGRPEDTVARLKAISPAAGAFA